MRGASNVPENARDSYPRLLVINRDAFAGAHYEVAYHALAAALHSACDEANQERVRTVQTLATQQRDWIDEHRPEHRMSSTSARTRGQNSQFWMLERQAAALRQLPLMKAGRLPP
jgi:ABC-type nitrate/sulfonate/bicarbonate transport system substrate-binding protein